MDDISIIFPAEFTQYGVENINISVKTASPTDEEYKKALRDVHIKKLIDSVLVSDDYVGKNDIIPSKVGQGTQRMIYSAMYYPIFPLQKLTILCLIKQVQHTS